MEKETVSATHFQHEQITKSVIGCAMEVINELGTGFLESVYEKALLLALRQKGLAVVAQHPIKVMFRKECVGDFYADLLVEEKVLVELKAHKLLAREHHAQLINYLNATGIDVGLLINFGNPKLEYRRFTKTSNQSNHTKSISEFDGGSIIDSSIGDNNKIHPVYPVHPCE